MLSGETHLRPAVVFPPPARVRGDRGVPAGLGLVADPGPRGGEAGAPNSTAPRVGPGAERRTRKGIQTGSACYLLVAQLVGDGEGQIEPIVLGQHTLPLSTAHTA